MRCIFVGTSVKTILPKHRVSSSRTNVHMTPEGDRFGSPRPIIMSLASRFYRTVAKERRRRAVQTEPTAKLEFLLCVLCIYDSGITSRQTVVRPCFACTERSNLSARILFSLAGQVDVPP